MATEILMPALSPTMEEGTLAKWLVKEGDTVSSGDIIAEIETDKATMEFEAVDEGVIGKLLVPEGTAGVKVNAPIAVLVEDGESVGDTPAPKAAAKAEEAPKQAAAAPEAAPKAVEKAPARAEGARVFASPLARRIAAEKGLDLSAVAGSGPHGRIVKADVETAKPGQPASAPAAEAKASTPEPKPEPQKAAMATGASADTVKKLYADRDYEEVTLDGMRRTIAARLTEAKQTIPHFYLRREIRLDALMEFRQTLNHQLAGRGVKLSVNDFIIKAGAVALQQVPDANAVWAGDRILKLKPSDVAVAVAVEGGLFTPVIRDADKKSLSALSAEMRDLAHRARDRKLAPHEYLGGSFAISNLGMYGIDNFDAVINPPHGSILAVGAGVKKPVVGKNDEIEVATVMSVTLSVDHRVIDGALGAEFLKAMADLLENPILMVA
ncbi:pyruvate dehydrogenase complex dihydrolipoamide acetyltransferase [Haematobacter massiliensis]|uniref:Acetyltransferase component of pyruvate dehydrogenase complex n=1 Tax=Haematobacter massiliensis TaxID=195105 RepID=A0A086YCW5_9RHOB|nr:pyruvate dehydrogenase complex dihydrolipoamide acetyltransferase [Haematobacter massiliensis]KFI32115.1 branched-chain alpha-keto acid dehydrogenase subunit E2 [Haematobacter massiliensis]OWJ72712.1 pyruvate dehydrogenase complex dihydrolipoamide acetyltransferase [Haematobacter massiliensis]OWJ85756.1 pyruvate dehydrogenase complex dihydrolipoamide acetyltransferase [Haematobacter massiliensis]QBJ24497.1 pyruvate dehydrogenase complex dihydrolipoamide acetyltransferase [Haematobacter massi